MVTCRNDMTSLKELIERGWSIVYDDTGDAVAVRTSFGIGAS